MGGWIDVMYCERKDIEDALDDLEKKKVKDCQEKD